MRNAMICPKCGAPMVEGRTNTDGGGRLQWLPVKRNIPAFQRVKTYSQEADLEGPVFLTRYTVMPQIHPAWFCTGCRLFLVDCQTELDEDFHDNPGPAPQG